MRLFGLEYVQASLSLQIMLLSMLAFNFNLGISTLVYSYGNYRQVLAIGLGSSISRIICYFVLVPLYGNTGAAISFAIGSLIGFAVAASVTRKIGMPIFWKELGLIFIVPTALLLSFGYFHVNYIVGIPTILIFSLILLFLLRVLSKSELHETVEILPTWIAAPLIKALKKL